MHDQASVKRHFNIIDFLVLVFLAATVLTLILRSNLSVDIFSTDKETTVELQIEVIAAPPLHDTLTPGTTILLAENGKTFATVKNASSRIAVSTEENHDELYKVVYTLTASGTVGTKGYVISENIPVSNNETFTCKTNLAGSFDALVLALSSLS